MSLRPAIFLDKDGTILRNVPYNADPEKMVFMPGAREGLTRLAGLLWPLVIVTNQPGLALGKFGRAQLHRMHRHMAAMFAEAGATLAGFYFCPHHPDLGHDGRTTACLCRKPRPGLLRAAASRLRLDLGRSWLIGDILDDIEAGRRAGCRTILIDNGNETEWHLNAWRRPHWRAPDLRMASDRILAMTTATEGHQ